MFWKRFLAKKVGLGKSPLFPWCFFSSKRSFLDLRGSFLGKVGRRLSWQIWHVPHGSIWVYWLDQPPPPTRGFQLVANKDLGRDSRSYNFMSSWCFYEPAFLGGGDSSKVYHSQFSGCSTRPPGVWQTCDPEDMVWCNFLAHEAKQPSSTLARVVVLVDS